MIRLICLLIGYAFGCFQTSYIYGKLHGIDIRNYGSGNAGTTNSLRVFGKKAGAIVFLCDILKTGLAMTLVRLLFREQYGDMMYLLILYTGAGAILGHNFPFYLRFKGGKGIACTAGMIIFYHPYMIPLPLVFFLASYLSTHYVSLGSLCTVLAFIIEMVIFGQLGLWGLEGAQLVELYIVAALIVLLAFWEHRENIKRLIHKTERKTYLKKKEKN